MRTLLFFCAIFIASCEFAKNQDKNKTTQPTPTIIEKPKTPSYEISHFEWSLFDDDGVRERVLELNHGWDTIRLHIHLKEVESKNPFDNYEYFEYGGDKKLKAGKYVQIELHYVDLKDKTYSKELYYKEQLLQDTCLSAKFIDNIIDNVDTLKLYEDVNFVGYFIINDFEKKAMHEMREIAKREGAWK